MAAQEKRDKGALLLQENPDADIEWTPYADLHLINALGGLKAIGVNHHFCLAICWQRFTQAMHIYISPENLRKRLESFYDFGNADKLVAELPFPNETQEFCLPEEIHPGALQEEPAVQLRPLMKDFTKSAGWGPTALPNVGSPGLKRTANSGRTTPTLKTIKKEVKKEPEKKKLIIAERKDTPIVKKDTPKQEKKQIGAGKEKTIVKKTEETPKRAKPSEEDRKTPVNIGKKRPGRLSESKPESPGPTQPKRARH